MLQKSYVLMSEDGELLVNFGEKYTNNTIVIKEAWISNYDTLRSVAGYIKAKHEATYTIVELKLDI